MNADTVDPKPTKRIRSPHPGVVLKNRVWPSGKEIWLARWFDPDTGKRKDTNLTKLSQTNAEMRRAWAIKKAKSLALRRADLEAGAATRTSTPLGNAYKEYLATRGAELSQSTIRNYREALSPFINWCARRSLSLVEEISPQQLAVFRDDHLRVAARTQLKGRGIKRGAKEAGTRRRSPHTINRVFRSLRTLLTHWRRHGLTPLLNSDSIRDSLAYVRAERPLPTYLGAAQVSELLTASMKHDCATYKATRLEHAEGLAAGSTKRYVAITPFVLTALLSGARFEEIRTLKWSSVDEVQKVLLLGAEVTKTRMGRRVDLTVSPLLLEMFKRMAKDAGPYVFGGSSPHTRTLIEAARKRLTRAFKAPEFTWHDLRRTCGTHLTCAPGIYGGASAFLCAKRLGHSVAVAEKHYLGVVNNISPSAKTLEDAMEIAELSSNLLNSI
ncbi:MAG: tyrosine-type recombinase/integrase [Planctomycetes bacterium]|jgi:integrase|nr:tyrosine-type recombinase/integrase [Planctomycetota bacterium]